MYKVGMYGGTFNPLHQGHMACIIQASTVCEKLYVVLCCSESKKEIPYQIRYKWLTQATKDMENVEVIKIFDRSKNKDAYNWKQGTLDICKEIDRDIDVVFCGNDYEKEFFSELYPFSSVVVFDRSIVPVSSTDIRENPFENWDMIPQVVRPHYVKKIVIIGTESCGKSTLVRNLAKYFNTSYVNEIGRDICDEVGGIENMVPEDFQRIFLEHKAKENELTKIANRVLLVDTEAIVTQYYLDLMWPIKSIENKDKVNKVEEIMFANKLGEMVQRTNEHHLYIYLEPDVEWVQDGTRIFGEDKVRIQNNKKLKEMFAIKGIPFVTMSGNYENRFLESVKIIKETLKI